jgi:formylglycine-generating enzyme required for sulfatase activity
MATLDAMSSQPVRLLEPVRWAPGLVGEFPGRQSFIELGPERVRMVFCWCPPTPPGRSFVMGSPPDELERSSDENQRPVEIPQGFWLARHPVNQRQWRAVMGKNPSRRGGSDPHPVDSVSWEDAQEFCRQAHLRLPTEAEWEYACRAGSATPFGIGSGYCLNSQMADFHGNEPYGSGRESFKWLHRRRTLPEGSFPPNAWGLHDMHGQLWEWCEDEYAGRGRVLRGGGWFHPGGLARAAYRDWNAPVHRDDYFGFRPCPSSTQGQGQAGGRPRAAERAPE